MVNIKPYETADGVVHWAYPMIGLLTVCGTLAATNGDKPWPNSAPTCFRCIAIVQAELHGELMAWSTGNDPTKKFG